MPVLSTAVVWQEPIEPGTSNFFFTAYKSSVLLALTWKLDSRRCSTYPLQELQFLS